MILKTKQLYVYLFITVNEKLQEYCATVYSRSGVYQM